MPVPIYTQAASDVWKRYGGDQAAVASYTAPTGSSANLTPAPMSPAAAPSPAQPAPSPVASHSAQLKSGTGIGANAVADISTDTLKTWLDANRPQDPGAYQGPEAQSLHWGGALIGGSRTGVQDYGNWQSQRQQYQQAMQNWQQHYADWQRRNTTINYGDANLGQSQPQAQNPQPQYAQQNPSQTPQNPYAVPGQRTPAYQPGAGQVQKPDQTASKVNERWTGVI